MPSLVFKEKNSGVAVKIDDVHKLTQEELGSVLDAIKEKLEEEDLQDRPIIIPIEIKLVG